jgi:alpha-tubulin suppressor-like RCC1 family protein
MKALVATAFTMCAVSEQGDTVYCWGTSNYGEVGDGTAEADGFVQVKGL